MHLLFGCNISEKIETFREDVLMIFGFRVFGFRVFGFHIFGSEGIEMCIEV